MLCNRQEPTKPNKIRILVIYKMNFDVWFFCYHFLELVCEDIQKFILLQLSWLLRLQNMVIFSFFFAHWGSILAMYWEGLECTMHGCPHPFFASPTRQNKLLDPSCWLYLGRRYCKQVSYELTTNWLVSFVNNC